MTPGERNLMNAEIRATVEAAVAPLLVEIATLKRETAALERVDRKHSGVHSGLGAKIRESRESQSEIKVQVDDTVDALARRDQQLVAALNEVRDELVANRAATSTSIAPAAQAAEGAKTQATEAATEARNAGIDLRLVKQDTARALKWWRNPAISVVAVALLRIAYEILTGAHVSLP